jgi:hypothetical protein
MRIRLLAAALAIASVVSSACGGGPRAATADLVAIRQPTPDPTLDAVVRDLPRALAGVVAPTPTPTPTVLVVVPVPKPQPKPAAATPTARPTVRPGGPTATRPRP